MANQVSERGQITIDRAVRKQLGIRPGMVAFQQVVDDQLRITFLPAPHRNSLFGILHKPGEEPKVLTGDDLAQAVIDTVAKKQRALRDEND